MIDYQGALAQVGQENPYLKYAGYGPANTSQASRDLIEAQDAGDTSAYPGYTYDPTRQQFIHNKTGQPMADGSGKAYKAGQLNPTGQDVTYIQDAQHQSNAFKRKGLRQLGLALAGGVTGGLLSAAGTAGALGSVGDVGSEGFGISPDFLAGGSELADIALPAGAAYVPGGVSGLTLGGGLGTDALATMPTLGATGGGGVLGALKGVVMNPDGSVNWSKALETFGKVANPQQGQGQQSNGALGNLASIFTNAEGMPAWGKIAGAGIGALGAAYGMSKAGNQASPPPLPASMTKPLTPLNFQRTVTQPTGDLRHYGENPAGEQRFFDDKFVPGHAGGGDVRGPGSGRDDKIDALLSDGEYVMDAETVAMLGDGSLDEGARRLDQMRTNLRKHKGQALAKGKFSPNAKQPQAYLPGGAGKAEGGAVNPQLGVRDLPPPNSTDPAPLPNSEGAYANEDAGAALKARLLLDEVRKSLGAQMTEREEQLLTQNRARPGEAKGGPIRADLFLRALKGAGDRPEIPRTKPLAPPGNLARLVGVLDKSEAPDLTKLTDAEMEDYHTWLHQLLNTPPPQKAKGGPIDIHGIAGGFPKPSLEERAAQLDQIKRMIEVYRQAQEAAAQEKARLGITEGTDPYNQKPKPKLELVKARGGLVEAQARVAAIQSKLKKAEGGPVKELSTFADKLENALEHGDTDLAVGE